MDKGQLKRYWANRRAHNKKLSQGSECIIDIVRVGTNHARLVVVSPYHDDFSRGARELQGTWRPKTHAWTFDGRSYRLLVELCNTVYGADNVTVAGWKGLLDEKDA